MPCGPNDLPIEIEAALAFGTGHHGTTLGCLRALVAELKRRRPAHVLDVGTGTGILAFAAAKALRQPVVAGDLDAEAVRTARENARANGLGPYLKLYEGSGVRHRLAHRPRHFDLVFANILARPLRLLAPTLARVVATEGVLVLSGLIAARRPRSLSSLPPPGLRPRAARRDRGLGRPRPDARRRGASSATLNRSEPAVRLRVIRA